MKRLNAKIYDEARRLGVKWILGGECGHMWRVLHQYMDTMNGPADFLEVPVSPVTGTVFENARSTKMVHICEFTADLIHQRQAQARSTAQRSAGVATYHDSCNPARAMGLLEEPRYILKSVCNNFHEMPENTIREQTFCCGSGAGLGTDENLEMRLRGGFPRANAVKYVKEKYGVNLLTCICAIDKATLPTLLEYWVPGVEVAGVHELLGNALVMTGEKERLTDLRGVSRHESEERGQPCVIGGGFSPAWLCSLRHSPLHFGMRHAQNLAARHRPRTSGAEPKAMRGARRTRCALRTCKCCSTGEKMLFDAGPALFRIRRKGLREEPDAHLPWLPQNKAGFCDRCHDYSGVSGPYCWNCHSDPQSHGGEEHAMKITRKDFLRLTGLSLLAGGAKQVVRAISGSRDAGCSIAEPVRLGMVIDLSKCREKDGCNECIHACNAAHNIPQIGNRAHEVKWIWNRAVWHGVSVCANRTMRSRATRTCRSR